MKKLITILTALILSLFSVLSVQAENGTVTYNGNAEKFIFEPGSSYSPTDLFPEFKSVMPGDSILQEITVKNQASNKVKVKIYMRALGAHEDSADFLSKLSLRVEKSADNKMEYMFDASADSTAQLSDWVCLGTLYSGGEVNLNVILDVPTTLDNQYSSKIGYLDWEFMVEEYPIEDSDPKPPKTGEDSNLGLWIAVMLCSAAVMFILIIWRRKEQNDKES